ncbi:MAG: 16S rRNA processing protein RimM [Clostridia bacterium]|nr:16S rRNA processing protein RimM [Clostridia bacterium]
MYCEYFLIGQVLRPQGVRGQVKVRPDTDDPARYKLLDTVYLKKGDRYEPISISDVSVRDGFVFCTLNNATTCEEAEAMRDTMLYIDRAHAVDPGEDGDFICDLIGCRVIDTKGNEIGTLKDVLQPGANDVYVIKMKKGMMYLPAVKHVVTETHTKDNYVVVDEERLPEVAVIED